MGPRHWFMSLLGIELDADAGQHSSAEQSASASSQGARRMAKPRRKTKSQSGRRLRDDWYVPLEVGRLEDRRVLNVAPVLAGANNLASVARNVSNAGNNGTLVANIVAGKISDPDMGAKQGIAITSVDNTNGQWQYSTNGGNSGGTWNPITGASATNALLLAADANTYIRFVPNNNFSGNVPNGLTFAAWDQTSGLAGGFGDTTTNGGMTAFSTATASAGIQVNDAPVLSGANNLTPIPENATTNGGTLVSALISGLATDADGNSIGIAITAVDNTHGTWQYSTNGGNTGGTWQNITGVSSTTALLLAGDSQTYVRFVPNTNFLGSVATGVTFQAWDGTSGTAGSTADASVKGGTTAFSTTSASSGIVVDNPPTITGTVPGQTVNDNQTINPFSGVTIGETDTTDPTLTVAVVLDHATDGQFSAASTVGWTKNVGAGTYTFSGDAAAATSAIQALVFVPTDHQVAPGSTVTTTFTVAASDAITPPVSDSTTTVIATAVNTAPTLAGSATNFPTISSSPVTNNGVLVSALIAGEITDPDTGQTEGIALTFADNTNGTWQYSTNNGSSWTNVGSVSETSALLLVGDANTRLRFVPSGTFSGSISPGVTFRAWDGFTGSATTTADTTTNGGGTAFSSAEASSSIFINTAPVLTGANNLTNVPEAPATNGGTLVSTLLAGQASDADGNTLGIAITGALTAHGSWQYSTDGGSTWNPLGTPSESAALLLAPTTLVRFSPKNNFVGTVTGGLTFRAWDQTTGTAGTTVDLTAAGATGGSTAYSTGEFSSSVVVEAPPTITGAATTNINDQQTATPFSGVTINDTNTPVETYTVTLTQSATANGTLSNLGGFVNGGGGVYTFTGTAAAATTALDAIVFTPTLHQTTPGLTVTTGFTINVADSAVSVTNSSSQVVATATNTAPTLSGVANFPNVSKNPLATNNGMLVSDLIAGDVTDPDVGQTEGIAITFVDNTNGAWQYSTNNGSTWTPIGAVSNAQSLLLASTNRVRFVPNGTFSGSISPGITFRAWDGFTGTATNKVNTNTNGNGTAFSHATASSSVFVNDAPTLTGVNNLPNVAENPSLNNGTTVAELIVGKSTDVNGNTLGVAVTGATNTGGVWQYSTDSGTTWLSIGSPSESAALLLAPTALVRFVPNLNYFGTVSNGLTLRAWDQTSGTAGSTVDLSATGATGGTTAYSSGEFSAAVVVEAPPTITGTTTTNITDQQTATPFSGVTIGDPNTPAETFIVTLTQSATTNGALSNLGGFVSGGSGVYTFVGTAAAATTAIDAIVFTPTAHQTTPGLSVETDFTINVADPTVSTTDTNTKVIATATNTAPTLSGAANFPPIQQSPTTNNGVLVSTLIAGQVTDPDVGQTEGIAVTFADNTNGVWQYSANGGASWTNIGVVSDSQTLLLTASTLVRFAPNGSFSGLISPGITFRAWDGFTGVAFSTADTTVNGGSTAFSAAAASSSILINDAPVLTGANNLPTIPENAASPSGMLVSDLIAGQSSDVNGNTLGIAVTGATNTGGQWQYSTNGGTIWTPIGSPSESAALLLAPTTLVRFKPNNNFFGNVTPGLTFRAWDQTSGAAGLTVDLSAGGATGGATAYSTGEFSSTIQVEAPPTITGAATTNINDQQTANPFSGVNIGDPNSPAETFTVTITESTTANGVLSNLGSFTNMGGGVYTFTGTAAAATTALQGIVFTPTIHEVTPGTTVTTTFTLSAADSVVSTTNSNSTVIVTATNTAPTLAGTINFPTIPQNPVTNNGLLVSDLIAGEVTDPDVGQTEGIAITNVDNTHGTWQYSTNGGTTWTPIGPVSNTSALLLVGDTSTRIRFMPNGTFSGSISPGIQFRAWDGFTGAAGTKVTTTPNGGSTAFSTTKATSDIFINDAPVLTGANNLPTIPENPTSNPGTTVASLISGVSSDVNGNTLGIAVAGSNNTNGAWQYSTDGGTTWTPIGAVSESSALLLGPTALVRFAPNSNFFGTVSPGLTLYAWDQTTGTAGTTVDLTAMGAIGGTTAYSTGEFSSAIVVEAPPTITGTTTTNINDQQTATPFSGVTIGDPNTPVEVFTVTLTQSATVNGTLSNLGGFVSGGGGVYTFTGTAAAATTALEGIVFTPTLHQATPDGTVTTTFSINVANLIVSTTDNTSQVVTTATNTAPTLTGAANFPAIQQNPTANGGVLVSTLIAGQVTDPDVGQTEGIAVTFANNTGGQWQYSTNSGSTWINIGVVSDAQALLLSSTTLVRFNPNGTFSGLISPGITFRAWDGFRSTAGTLVDTTINGGMTAFSTAHASSSILINDAPVLTGANNLTTILENPTSNPGTSVAALLAGQATDVNGNVLGIAVTGLTSTNGTWKYSTDGGTTWVAFGAVSNSSALLLTPTTLVQFVPNPNFFGVVTPGITFHAWDQVLGTAGSTVDLTQPGATGGTTSFSTASASSAIRVNAPPTITGTVANQDVGDNATISLFSTAIIGDPNVPAETLTVVVTIATPANGTFSANSLAGWSTVTAGSVYMFTGTAAQATSALQALVFVPTIHQVPVDSPPVVTAFSIAVTNPFNPTVSDSTTTVRATAINDSPTLSSSTGANLPTITESSTSNSGATVSSLVSAIFGDVDNSPLVGIAITGTTVGAAPTGGNGAGYWEYSTDNGTTWTAIGTVSSTSALVLRDTDLVRFHPDGNNGNTATITFVAWDQTGSTHGKEGTKLNASAGGGTSPFSTMSATSQVIATDQNSAPLFTNSPQTILVPATVPGMISGNANGTPFGQAFTTSDVDTVKSITYSIDPASNPNGAFAINPTTGVLTVADASKLGYSPTPISLTIIATQNQFDSISPAAATHQTAIIELWSFSASASAIKLRSTTLSYSVGYAGGSTPFDVEVTWDTGISDTTTATPNVPESLGHFFATTPMRANQADPITITITVTDAQGHTATFETSAAVPSTGLGAVAVVQSTPILVVALPVPVIAQQAAAAPTVDTSGQQITDSGVGGGEASSTDQRKIFMRLVDPLGQETNSVIPLNDQSLDDLPALFKRLPDGRYRVYLSESGKNRLVIDVVVRQGRPVDPNDESSGGADRPPTSQNETPGQAPIVESADPTMPVATASRGANGHTPANPPSIAPQPSSAPAPVNSGAAASHVPLNAGASMAPSPSAAPLQSDAATKPLNRSRWRSVIAGVTAAAGAATLAREEIVDRALEQFDNRPSTRVARRVRRAAKKRPEKA